MAAAEYGGSTTQGAGKEGIVAALRGGIATALRDPIALFAERSPGSRVPGALHLTKPGAGPHERVLSEVRERPVVLDLPPAAVEPLFADNPPEIAPHPSVLPEDTTAGEIGDSFFPTFVNSPFGFPLSPTSATDNPGGTDVPPGGPGSGDIPPGRPGGFITPPGGTDTPGSPGGPDTPPPTIALPEPSTWLLMILGLAVFITMRRREGRRTGRPSMMEMECGPGCDY